MSKLRLLFVKEGPAAYISNLDLLRTVQRAFPRTELDIRHSQGFHPHPIISIVLPLPVGQSSDCELLDFEVTQETDGAGIAEKLNGGLPEGLTILDCYEARRPVRELTYLQAISPPVPGTAPMKVPMMEERISVGKIRFRSDLEGKTCSIFILFFSAL